MAQSFTVAAPLESVRRFALDLEAVARCTPGVESAEARGDRICEIVASERVVTKSVQLRLRAEITDDDGTKLRGHVSGDSFDGESGLELDGHLEIAHESEAITRLAFELEGVLRGKLAALGGGIAVRLKARQMARGFAAEFTRRIESGGVS